MGYKDGVGATLNRLAGPAAYRFRYGLVEARPPRGHRGDLWWTTDSGSEKLTVWSDNANAWISGGLADGDYGDITISGGGTVLTIDNNVVNFAKMADLANQRVIGRNTAGTGDPEALTITQVLDWLSGTQGALPYRGSSAWAALAPGTASQLLSTRGAAANPQWRNLPSPLTDGVQPIPAFIFASGDVIMVEGGA